MGISNQYKVNPNSTRSPANLPNLVLWLDGSYSDSIERGTTTVSRWGDKSNNKLDMTKTITLPDNGTNNVYYYYGIFGNTDKFLHFPTNIRGTISNFPATTGTMILSTNEGTAAYAINIPSGTLNIGSIAIAPINIIGQVICGGSLNDSNINRTISYYQNKGGGNNYESVTDFSHKWRSYTYLTSFPNINTTNGTNFNGAWSTCSSLTSFPLINTANGTNFRDAWQNCNNLTSFPLINTSSGTNFYGAWSTCSSLTSFPLINTANGTDFSYTWQNCNNLTSFPLIDTSNGIYFGSAWQNCNNLTSFPLINTINGINFSYAWYNCNNLTSFPLINTSKSMNFSYTWQNCNNLTSFPANMFNSCVCTNFTDAFFNTNLSQTSIDNILVSINSNGTSNGTFKQSGGSAPSATGQSAITSMRSRGWTVIVTGGF